MSNHTYTNHHIKPKSRGGTKTTKLPKAFHQSWHVLFQDMYAEEIIIFIKDLQTLFAQKNKVTAKELHDLRKEIKSMNLNEEGSK